MVYKEEEFLQLSGIQHYLFCRRQWALIHIEQQWEENYQTVSGEIFHEKVHDEGFKETRNDVIKVGAKKIHSFELGLSGECDILEFHKSEQGIVLPGKDGLWNLFPVEYKIGKPKIDDIDRAQLCAQVMCLEEMYCCSISQGAIFYGKTKRREIVDVTDTLRIQVKEVADGMHRAYRYGKTPKPKRRPSCKNCSLEDVCTPILEKKHDVAGYIREYCE